MQARKFRVVAVAGARPNFMKVAPLLRALGGSGRFASFLVHTGQHYDEAMSESFFRELGIARPDVNLGVGSGSHAAMTAEVLRQIEPILVEQEPDALLVVGDVNSTLAAALAASKLGVRIAHVEAGLRSGDRAMPEEINRVLTDAISDWLFVTEPAGRENLLREGVAPERIHLVGNVMIDTLVANLARAREQGTLARLGLRANEYVALTLHRPSNVDDPAQLSALFAVFEELQRELPVVFPVHPRTRAVIERQLGGRAPALRLTEPLGYLDFLALMADARFVLTDSGGVQEETTALGVPCLTMRANTERPITVAEGTNVLAGTDPAVIRTEIHKLQAGETKRGRVPALWDGHAAERIAGILARELERTA
ncbi:MAG: UDP-N-acetylglucosamine 2-epimerase (non-hydrolyzing) [Deltaproteobacteria bacterium]|nr:UDP-N-acetylglucosamine 2-epimerase (non-hydrolyzing) [Deltaproteobacteria bacterium]